MMNFHIWYMRDIEYRYTDNIFLARFIFLIASTMLIWQIRIIKYELIRNCHPFMHACFKVPKTHELRLAITGILFFYCVYRTKWAWIFKPNVTNFYKKSMSLFLLIKWCRRSHEVRNLLLLIWNNEGRVKKTIKQSDIIGIIGMRIWNK